MKIIILHEEIIFENSNVISIHKTLENGSNGIVFLGKAKYGNKIHKVAIKVALRSIVAEKLENELQLYKKMSDLKIGPTFYESFKNKTGNITRQYIITSAGDGDLSELIKSTTISEKTKCLAIKKSLKMIKKAGRKQIFCLDIKMNNFVYKIKSGRLTIRMIDFDYYFCDTKINKLIRKMSDNYKTQVDYYCVIEFIQLMFSCFSNRKPTESMIKVFYDETLLKKYFNNPEKIYDIVKFMGLNLYKYFYYLGEETSSIMVNNLKQQVGKRATENLAQAVKGAFTETKKFFDEYES